MFNGLTKKEKEKLQYEVISKEARLRLTRLLRHYVHCEDENVELIRKNKIINIARMILGLPVYVLESDDMGDYWIQDKAWHNGELELVMLRPDTIQLMETLADLIDQNILSCNEVNDILIEDSSSIYFEEDKFENTFEAIQITPIEEIEEVEDSEEHPNIRKLINRMENSLNSNDYSAVLHSSASIFETLAKDVVKIETIQDKSLGSFFDRYRKDSVLPEPILDYILEIFNKRNKEPLAGHGSTEPPSISEKEAIILVDMTKTFVRLERKLISPHCKH